MSKVLIALKEKLNLVNQFIISETTTCCSNIKNGLGLICNFQ